MATFNQKHLTLEQRIIIQTGISNLSSLKSIAHTIGKDPTTVKKEIIRHRIFKPGNHYGEQPSFKCQHHLSCSSANKNDPAFCNSSCPSFLLSFCKIRDKSPFACNGCKSLKPCRKDKFIYDAKTAQADYEATLSDSRLGVDLSISQASQLSVIIKPLIDQGQSPAQILMGHPELPFCEKTLYSYIHNNILPGLADIDLRKKVKYKPRNKINDTKKPDKKHIVNHTFDDFNLFISTNPFLHIVELDSVEGSEGKSGKILHTLLFIEQNFLIAWLSDHSCAASSVDFFDYLQKKLTLNLFIHYFSLILTDRGSEFSNIHRLEFDSQENQRSHVFYCDAMHSWDKGALENAHHYIRSFLPKGTSFSFLTQDKVDLMISHINSSPRQSLNGKTPFECMEFFYGDFLMKTLHIQKISRDDVILKPSLLK